VIVLVLPVLTPQQRAAALAKAAPARQARSQLPAGLKSGALSLTDVLARDDDVARKTKVTALVKSLPGYGPARTAAVLEAAGIARTRRLGALSDQQRKRLTDAIGN
jgi:hypothetical protein